MSMKRMTTIGAAILTLVGAAGSAGAWLHSEVFLPSVVKVAVDESHAKMIDAIRAHEGRPHTGAVTAHELELVIQAIDRVERNIGARMSTLERAVLSK